MIVGVDGHDGGRDAIALAQLLLASDGQLTLAHVRAGGLFPPTVEDIAFEAETEAPDYEKSLQLLERERRAADLSADIITAVDPTVGHGLHAMVEREHADLLVIGSHYRGFLGRPVLGNDVRDSLNGCACAVAIAPRGYASKAHSVQAIGVGYDGSQESVELVAVARRLATRHGADVRVLDIVELVGWPYDGWGSSALEEARNESLAKAEKQVGELEGVEGYARIGVAREELAVFTKIVDLLLIGSRGHGPVHRLMLGNTSEYLADHSRCPLLVLPRSDVRDPDAARR